MEIEKTKPAGFISVAKSSKIYPGSFVVRGKGDCMDSDKAAKRIRNGDYLLCHPIDPKESVGKVVIVSTPIGQYIKQVVRVTKTNLVVKYFKPYRVDIYFPLSDVLMVYSVDEVLENPTIKKL